MIEMRKIEKKDNKLLDQFLKNKDISEKFIEKNFKNTVIMIENKKIIGLSVYKKIDKLTGIISYIGYNKDFLTPDYKDGFLRAILNVMLRNGIFYSVLLANKKNYEFYKTYNFDLLKKNENYIKYLKENHNIVAGFKVNIQKFFNRPCSSNK
ncbi:MAG: hypothetical protein ACQEQE_05915 [Bacillota bacterium]